MYFCTIHQGLGEDDDDDDVMMIGDDEKEISINEDRSDPISVQALGQAPGDVRVRACACVCVRVCVRVCVCVCVYINTYTESPRAACAS